LLVKFINAQQKIRKYNCYCNKEIILL